jgi:hypothetical protein
MNMFTYTPEMGYQLPDFDDLYEGQVGLSVPTVQDIIRIGMVKNNNEEVVTARLLIQKSDNTINIAREDACPIQVEIDGPTNPQFSLTGKPELSVRSYRVFSNQVSQLVFVKNAVDHWAFTDEEKLVIQPIRLEKLATIIGMYAMDKQISSSYAERQRALSIELASSEKV